MSWPRAVWASSWLRGLDERGRSQIEAAGALRALEAGSRLFSAGDVSDAFFVVIEGLVDVRAVRRGDADASALRRAAAGDAVGEEAVVRPGGERGAEARCATRVLAAEVPVAVFRRAIERAGASYAARLEEPLRRAAAQDVLRASSLSRALSARDIDALAGAATHRSLSRGDALFSRGDRAAHAYVVAAGMVQVQTDDEPRPRVRAYLGRGDLVVDRAFESGGAHEVTVAACGSAWVLAIERGALLPVALRSPEVFAGARRLVTSPPLPEATRHVLGDLWRFAVAGSMLVIDDEACVRCGHCVWSCAQAHEDGVARLVRRGEKVHVRDAADGTQRALLVPGSCQHCKHPACMVDCPTGAIARDTGGEVHVREALCVGCGQCAKACPWGSVQMAPRAAPDGKRRLPLASARGGEGEPHPSGAGAAAGEVAVKCDLCRGSEGGPACVAACPVDAIARIEPLAAIAEVRQAVGVRAPRRALPGRRRGGPWIAAAAVIAAALARVPEGVGPGRMATGLFAGGLMAALAAYVAVKRTRWGRRGDGRRSRVQPYAVAHVALGVLAIGAVLAHAGGHARANAAGALLVALAVASVAGLAASLAYCGLPSALSRVERRARLPEELASAARELDERVFGALTGRSDATKAVYARLLAPYARASLGPVALLLRRASLAEEEARMRARLERVLGSRAAHLDGIDDLIRLAVERRAIGAQRLLQAALRAGVVVHVVSAAVAAVLLVVHVACVLGSR